jgi:hypothetical protein
MNLVQTSAKPAVYLTCSWCGYKGYSDGKQPFYADTEGEPFKEYWCESCAMNSSIRASITRHGENMKKLHRDYLCFISSQHCLHSTEETIFGGIMRWSHNASQYASLTGTFTVNPATVRIFNYQ